MSRRFKGTVAIVGALALCLSLFAVGVSGKSKIRRVGSSTQVETSTHGKRNIVVTGLVQSSVAKCERDRSVLLYQDGPGGTFVGAALGHSTSVGRQQPRSVRDQRPGAEEDPRQQALSRRDGRPQGHRQGQARDLQARRLGPVPGHLRGLGQGAHFARARGARLSGPVALPGRRASASKV